jgi:hypothetical protein
VLLAFATRELLALLIVVACLLALAGGRKNAGPGSSAVPMLFLAAGSIAAQPVLGGPEITAGNGPRLVSLGLLPLCVALGVMLRDREELTGVGAGTRLRWLIVLLALGSLHHWYALAANPSSVHKLIFGAAYAGAAVGCYALMGRMRHQPDDAPLQARVA